jgi:hypothetical protein
MKTGSVELPVRVDLVKSSRRAYREVISMFNFTEKGSARVSRESLYVGMYVAHRV